MGRLIRYELKKILQTRFAMFACVFACALLVCFFSLDALTTSAFDWQRDEWVYGPDAIALWKARAERVSGPLDAEKLEALEADVTSAAQKVSSLNLDSMTNEEAVATVGADEAEATLGTAHDYLYLALLKILAYTPGDYDLHASLEAKLDARLDAGKSDGSQYSDVEKTMWRTFFAHIESPVVWGYGEPSSSLIHYAGFFALCVMACIVAASGVFSREFKDRTAPILRSCVWGRGRLGAAKLIASTLFGIAYFAVSAGLCLGVACALFGTGSFDLSVQVVSSQCPYALTCGQMLGVLFGAGCLIVVGCVIVSALLSLVLKNGLAACVIGIVFIFFCVIVGGVMPNLEWLLALTPWNALEMIPSSLVSYDFGSFILPLPVMVICVYIIVSLAAVVATMLVQTKSERAA